MIYECAWADGLYVVQDSDGDFLVKIESTDWDAVKSVFSWTKNREEARIFATDELWAKRDALGLAQQIARGYSRAECILVGSTGPEVLRVPISAETYRLARKCADEIECNLSGAPDGDYTGLEAPDRWFSGYLGEFTFAEVLDRFGKRFRHNVRTDGRAGGAEFDVYVQRLHKRLDVKTGGQELIAGASAKWAFQLIESQFQLHGPTTDAYVAARVDGRDIVFQGWAPKKQVAECVPETMKVLTRQVWYRDLASIRRLIEQLDPAKTAVESSAKSSANTTLQE